MCACERVRCVGHTASVSEGRKGRSQEARLEVGARKAEGLYTSRNNNDYKKIPCSSLEWREGTFATVARTRGVGCLWAEIHLVQVCNFRSKFLLGFFYKYQVRSGRTYGKR